MIAPFEQRLAGAAQPFHRAVLVDVGAEIPTRGPSQGPPHALARIAQLLLQPGLERQVVETRRLVLREDLKLRVDTRLDRPLAQQVGAEPVDGADTRLFQVPQGLLEPVASVAGLALSRGFELFAQAQFQLAGRLLGERHGDDLVDGGAGVPGREHVDDARDQLGGLARAGRRLDDVGVRQVGPDAIAVGGIGLSTRGVVTTCLARRRGPGSGLPIFRPVRRSSPEPQTTLKSHHSHAPSFGYGASTACSTPRSTISSTSSPIRRVVSVNGTERSANSPAAVQNHNRPSRTG